MQRHKGSACVSKTHQNIQASINPLIGTHSVTTVPQELEQLSQAAVATVQRHMKNERPSTALKSQC